jgi:predicted metal-dependent hydrolase
MGAPGEITDPGPPSGHTGLDPEELSLLADPRLAAAIAQFNAGDWYGCHDGFEELWHETAGLCRPVLQGILQIAVGQLHAERGNRRGATILTGEGLGRLTGAADQALGLDLLGLRRTAQVWLKALQDGSPLDDLAPPALAQLQPPGGDL